MNAEFFEEQRREMVAAIRAMAEHMAPEIGKTALDERVLRVMAKVPRHEFVPVEVQRYAYLNKPIPIGFDKTISQPMMVAVMTDLLELKPDDVVLEIGTGLGYQSAVLDEVAGRVYSVEIIDELAQRAIRRLKQQGYTNIEVRIGNGYTGWPEHAPFDKVMVTAAPDLIPPPLINQLKASYDGVSKSYTLVHYDAAGALGGDGPTVEVYSELLTKHQRDRFRAAIR